jgi:Arc/MetJ-type ribon-helix-helix transcriptional regulator
MTAAKERLTVTVDPELVEAGNRAVAAGRAGSLSAWVNEALTARAERDRRLEALADAIAGYEADHGEITAAELAAQERRDREEAVVVRGSGGRPTGRGRRRTTGAA